MLTDDMPDILETYHNATGLPIYYIDCTNKILFKLPDCMNYQALLDYFDFTEVLESTKLIFARDGDSSMNICHILYTRSLFIYTINVLSTDQGMRGAVITGPVPAYQPDENQINELLLQNGLPLHRKPEMKALLMNLPSVTSEQLEHCSILIFLLFKSKAVNKELPKPEIHNNWIPPKQLLNNLLSDDIDTVLNRRSGLFLMSIRKLIIEGDMKKTEEFLNNSFDKFHSANIAGNIMDSLKIKYFFLCAYSCICSVQGNAPYKYVVNILNHAMANMKLWKTPEDIVIGMAAVIKDCTQTVSANIKNQYSLHVSRALQYIRDHYTNKITLEMLADQIKINPVYLSSLIKKETNYSLPDNINKIRIEESCNLLSFTDKSINEIAFIVGYSYQNHYCRVFKKFIGISPMEYRRTYRQ